MMSFLHGMVTMGFVFAGLFFLRFWRRTKEGLHMTPAERDDFSQWMQALRPND